VSDALGTATELRAMKNYAGHRLSPWLGHIMVSRQETARPLLTPGEVMQLPPDDELVLVSGCPPIRAKKARYSEDRRLSERVLAPPKPQESKLNDVTMSDDWSRLPAPAAVAKEPAPKVATPPSDDPANAGIRREPDLRAPEEIAPAPAKSTTEFTFAEENSDDEVARASILLRQGLARQAAMDPDDGLGL
jgi:type IV secretion system protein VirD4